MERSDDPSRTAAKAIVAIQLVRMVKGHLRLGLRNAVLKTAEQMTARVNNALTALLL